MTGSIDTQRKEFEEFTQKLDEMNQVVIDEQDRALSPTVQDEAKNKRQEKLKSLLEAREADKLILEELMQTQTNNFDPRHAMTLQQE